MARTERAAGICSLVAAGIHGLVSPAHFEQWWGYGLFFVAAGLAQAVVGLFLLTNAVTPEGFGPRWLVVHRRVLWAGVVGNVLIIALYVVTRTVGLPAGPATGEVEEVGVVDVVSKIAEAAVIGLAGFSLLRGPRPGPGV